ncbi:MAG TPA: hypothetical protein VER37_04290, partial [Thermomicrobiales bacterium]|nr:hypothetical protein [Thermomicrobiales bacterium]
MRFSTTRRPFVSIVFALLVAVATLGALVALPGSAAAETTAMDATILAGPGWEYEPLTYAPAGSPISVDGAAVGSCVPVTYAGTSGWADVSVVGAGSATLAQEAPPAEAAAPVEEAPSVEMAPPADAAAPAPAEAPAADAAGVSEEAVVAEEAAPVEGAGRSGRGNGG